MCLALPMVVSSIEKNSMAVAELMGVKRKISILLVPGVQAGDHVLVHAGTAIEIINHQEAEERNFYLKSMLEGSG